MNTLTNIGTLLSTALIAGLFFTWSNAIMSGFRKLPAQDFLTVMQACNRTILNPLFMICFLAPVMLLPLKTYLQFKSGISLKFYLLLSASFVYIVGVFILTIWVHIPINETLDKLTLQDTQQAELSAYKELYLNRWIPYNTFRAVNAFISFLLLVLTFAEKD